MFADNSWLKLFVKAREKALSKQVAEYLKVDHHKEVYFGFQIFEKFNIENKEAKTVQVGAVSGVFAYYPHPGGQA